MDYAPIKGSDIYPPSTENAAVKKLPRWTEFDFANSMDAAIGLKPMKEMAGYFIYKRVESVCAVQDLEFIGYATWSDVIRWSKKLENAQAALTSQRIWQSREH